MGENDSWIYQGRQYHMWFGHGTKPEDDGSSSPASDALPSLQDRIHNVGYALVAGLPASKRHHGVARLDAADHGRLSRALTGVVHALPLGPRLIPPRVLGTHAEASGVAPFVQAGGVIHQAKSHADLREATDLVARSAQQMGLDHFQPFLRRADEHLTQTGGMAALLRDRPPAPTLVRVSPSPAPVQPGFPAWLPPVGELLPLIARVLRGAGWLALAGVAIGARPLSDHDSRVRAVIDRFRLDPSKPADMAAAVAYAWALVNRSLLVGTASQWPPQEMVAAQVMRAVRADPSLLDRALAGDSGELATIQALVKAMPQPGTAYEVRTDEERALVTQLIGEGRSGAEIQAALDQHRKKSRPLTAEERRNKPGVVRASTKLSRAGRGWLADSFKSDDGTPIPEQIAEKLVGKRFSSFRALRAAIWSLVAHDPELSSGLNGVNLRLMRRRLAPRPPRSEQVVVRRTGLQSRRTWELHHDPSIKSGGEIYDLSALRVVTPKQHDAIHKKGNSR